MEWQMSYGKKLKGQGYAHEKQFSVKTKRA